MDPNIISYDCHLITQLLAGYLTSPPNGRYKAFWSSTAVVVSSIFKCSGGEVHRAYLLVMHRLPRALQLRQLQQIKPRLSRPPQWRSASQYVYRSDGQRMRFQNVRLRPRSNLRSTSGLILTTLTLYAIARWAFQGVVIEIGDGGDEESEGAEGSAGKDGQEEIDLDEDDPLFIPLTWPTEMPREYYRGSDPEWQQFIRVAKDRKLQDQINKSLLSILSKNATMLPPLANRLGKDPEVAKYMLDYSYPDGPPPDYERTGIAIGSGYIALVVQTITPEEYQKLSRLVFPRAAIESTLEAGRVTLGIHYRRLKQALGIEGKDPKSLEERWKTAVDLMQRQEEARSGKQVDKAGDDSVAGAGVMASGHSASGAQSARSSENGGRIPWHFPMPLPSNSVESGSFDGPIGLRVFTSNLAKKWNPKSQEPPRGCFIVQGLVELKGTRGRLLFDVAGFYSPEKSKFVWMNAQVRSYKPRSQPPKGGP